jgi:hypothetical protein
MWLADFSYVLIFFAAIIVLGIFSAIPILGVLFALAIFVLYVAFIALAPLFSGLVQAAFYEEITAKLAAPGFCTGCGQPLAPGASFCTNCGKSTR